MKFEAVSEQNRKHEGEVVLPLRATKSSCGYDFVCTEDVVIEPQKRVFFFTDVKVELPQGKFLYLVVRSSLGVKKGLMLANTNGIIDADYYNNANNEGNIGLCLRNMLPSFEFTGNIQIGLPNDVNFLVPQIRDLKEQNTITLHKGDRVVQGIILDYYVTEFDNATQIREGGFGSTDNK